MAQKAKFDSFDVHFVENPFKKVINDWLDQGGEVKKRFGVNTAFPKLKYDKIKIFFLKKNSCGNWSSPWTASTRPRPRSRWSPRRCGTSWKERWLFKFEFKFRISCVKHCCAKIFLFNFIYRCLTFSGRWIRGTPRSGSSSGIKGDIKNMTSKWLFKQNC